MKKLNLIFIVIIGIVFVTGCIGGEKANNSKPESNLQSPDVPIDLNNILEGYYSNDDNEFKTYAISKEEPFEVQPNLNNTYFSQGNEYEGDIPFGKKRITTTFQLVNEEKSIIMNVLILESDSNSKLKEFINEGEIQYDQSKLKKDVVADYSFQYSEGSSIYPRSMLVFSIRSNFISIEANSLKTGISKENIEEETLKVAKAINSKIIDGIIPPFQLQERAKTTITAKKGASSAEEGYEVSEAAAMQDNLAGKVIFVNGTFVIGTEKWDNLNQTLTFKMTDGKTTIDVVYKGDKPYIPSEATQTVVTGQFNNGVLEAFKMVTRFQP